MGIKDILNKLKRKNVVYDEMKAQDKAASKIEERKLSAEERALHKILEKKRQAQIHVELQKHYKKDDDDYWHKDVISQPNIFKGESTLLNSPSILKQKHIFIKRRVST